VSNRKCFRTTVESKICHVEIIEEAGSWKAVLWVENGVFIQPLLTESNRQPAFLAAGEGEALVAALEFLQDQMGSRPEPAVPCEAHPHAMARV
jgi:hypothetical protein